MDVKEGNLSPEGFKIICKNYPSEFILDKNLAKEYFRQFGKIKRMVFKQKLRICTVEYVNEEGFIEALNGAGEYQGQLFKVSAETSPEKKKIIRKSRPIWIDDDVKSELEAMGGGTLKTHNLSEVIVDLTDNIPESPKIDKVPKLKRSRTTETVTKQKKQKRTMEKLHTVMSPEQLELINLVKSQATSIEEKYRVLDARDKLIRMKLKKSTRLKSSPTTGTCPDMCPEKERLMRETQHQVALYEQEDNGRVMNHSKAVKQYSRSSADQESPLPHDLRPVSVLQMTMGYLMHSIIDMCDNNEVNLAEWFHFLWDRTRGIRKDITQQELCSQGAVELVEQCARFHIHCSARLVSEDPAVFDQKINTENLTKCLQTLKYMYHDLQLKGENCHNEAEFRAYIILLNLNDGNFMWEVQELREEIQKSQEVKFALQVYSALDKNNYVKFFKLVHLTTYLNACILMRYFIQVRTIAIKTLLKCYKPRAFKTIYPLSELTRLLAFEDMDSTIDFMLAYGLSINEDKTHIILEKNTFMLPEFPYILDRSLNVVECKRTCSVGMIVCGKELPPKIHESHIPHNSFDNSGHLICEDILEEFDLEQPKINQPTTEELIPVDMEMTPTSASDIIFIKNQERTSPNIFASKANPPQPSKEIGSGSFFTQGIGSQGAIPAKDTTSIFGQSETAKSSPSIFGNKPEIKATRPLQDQTDSIPIVSQSKKQATPNIFAKAGSIFAKSTTKPSSIFGGTIAKGLIKETSSSKPKKGGFIFDLPITREETAPGIFTSAPVLSGSSFLSILPETENKIPVSSVKMPITSEDFEMRESQPSMLDTVGKLEELRREKEKEAQEQQRKQLELEKKLLEERKVKEEKLREIKKKKQEEEIRRKREELRKEKERLKTQEIETTVKVVLETLITRVDDFICEEKVRRIRNNIQRRMMLRVVKNWQRIVWKNKRRRQAMDCSPVWVNTKSPKQSADELHTSSQELTLNLMKRYRQGKPIDIGTFDDDKTSKIDLLALTYRTLNQRFFQLRNTLQKNIFWKVEISLPDHYELRNGLNRIEDTLMDAFQWEDRNGTIMLVEQKKYATQSVTYCIERQRGLFVRYTDANGIIFIAKDFNSLLQRRIVENLKNFGVFTKVPIVIILEKYDVSECNLKTLIDQQIVSDYIILIDRLSSSTLVSLVEEGLVFLASKVEKPPPLELDTLSAFTTKYLCTEIWKRANSYAKWNSHYKICLRNPNNVISLYNEGLSKLKEIVLNKSCLEYASFPEVFRDYLETEVPDYLPCNYYYFPKFWKTGTYINKVEKIMNNLQLPEWLEKWPPINELELEKNVSAYCANAFREGEKPFFKIMSVLLRGINPSTNFEDIKKVLWTNVIEVLGLEKLREADLSFTGSMFENKSIYKQVVVIYDVDTLENYRGSDWFYINNPLIKRCVKRQLIEERTAQVHRNEPISNLNSSIDLDKTISLVTNKLQNVNDSVQIKKDLAEFNALMNDLETSIKVHKKISSKFGENLKKAIEDNN